MVCYGAPAFALARFGRHAAPNPPVLLGDNSNYGYRDVFHKLLG
jgi:hypothetical protein